MFRSMMCCTWPYLRKLSEKTRDFMDTTSVVVLTGVIVTLLVVIPLIVVVAKHDRKARNQWYFAEQERKQQEEDRVKREATELRDNLLALKVTDLSTPNRVEPWDDGDNRNFYHGGTLDEIIEFINKHRCIITPPAKGLTSLGIKFEEQHKPQRSNYFVKYLYSLDIFRRSPEKWQMEGIVYSSHIESQRPIYTVVSTPTFEL